MAQPLRRNLDDAAFLVVMGFKAVHQDLLVRALKDPVVAFDARALESGGRNWPKIASYSANPHDGALFLREPRSIKGPAKPRLIRARASLGESITCGRRRMRSSARWTAEVVSLHFVPPPGDRSFMFGSASVSGFQFEDSVPGCPGLDATAVRRCFRGISRGGRIRIA